MLPVRNYKTLLLAALLVGAVSTAWAGTSCGINLEYTISGTTLVLTSPDPTQPATIYSQAFKDRTDITDIVFPDNLTMISSAAFYGCTGITDIVLPPALTSIDVEAFRGCTSLVSVLCRPYDAPDLGNDGFTDCHTDLQICVPNLGSYNAKNFWWSYSPVLCYFLDENDAPSVAENKIKFFRNSSITEVDIFRTLRKAGCFNTLTLPFNVPNIASSPLTGAEVYEFVGATVVDNALQLDISPLTGSALTAGTPYLIQWPNPGEVMTRLSFTGISWDTDQTADNAGTGQVTFHGFYGKTHISDGANHSNLFLGANNTLFWPAANDNSSMLGFRAYFQVNSVQQAPAYRGMPATLNIVSTPTNMGQVQDDKVQSTKVLRNGQIFIIRNGEQYSITGQKL